MAIEVLPEEQGVPASCWPPRPGTPVLGREIAQTSGFKNHRELHPSKLKATGDLSQVSKGPYTDTFAHNLALSSSIGVTLEKCQRYIRS